MRFELIDRVVEQAPNRLVALKAVTTAEEYLQDHFPGFAVLPGVMMLEALGQTGRRLIEAALGEGSGPWVMTQVRNVRYGNLVRPGDTLRMEVALRKRERIEPDEAFDFDGVGRVNEQVAVQGRFTLSRLHPPHHPAS